MICQLTGETCVALIQINNSKDFVLVYFRSQKRFSRAVFIKFDPFTVNNVFPPKTMKTNLQKNGGKNGTEKNIQTQNIDKLT